MKKRLFFIMIIITSLFFFASIWSFIRALNNKASNTIIGQIGSSSSNEILVWASDENYNALISVKDDMLRKTAKYTLKLEKVEDSTIIDKYKEAKIKPDVVLASRDITNKLIENNSLDLYDFTNKVSNVSNSMNQHALKELAYNNKFYAIPFNLEPIVMLYNKQDIESLKIDISDIRTWDNYLSYANKLNKKAIFIENNDTSYITSILNKELHIPKLSISMSKEKIIQSMDVKRLIEKLNDGHLGNYNNYDELKEKLKSNDIFGQPVSASLLPKMINEMNNISNKYEVSYIPSFNYGGNNRVSYIKNCITVFAKDKESNILEMLKDLYSNPYIVEYNVINNGLIPCYGGDFIDNTTIKDREKYFNNDRVWIKVMQGGANMN